MEATLLAVNVRPEEVLCAGEANLVSCVPVACSAMTKEWNCVIGRTGGAFNSKVTVHLMDIIMQKVEVKAAFVTKACEVSDVYTWGDGKQSAIIVPCFSDLRGVGERLILN